MTSSQLQLMLVLTVAGGYVVPLVGGYSVQHADSLACYIREYR